jgi:hypothetical protein
MKRKEKTEVGDSFEVTCAWCGVTIRHAAIKDAERMCHDCHARMLGEHLRAQRAEPMFEYASER